MIYDNQSDAALPANVSCAVDQVDKTAWHELLRQFVDASVMQSWSYAAGRWPEAELSHLTVHRDGRPVAMAQVVLRTIPVLGGGLAYVHFGPLWQPQSDDSNESNLRLVLRCLCIEYVTKRGMLLRVRPWPSRSDGDMVTPLFEGSGFTRHVDRSPDRFLVDLAQSKDKLHEGLQGKWRYNLKRSHKHDLKVVHLDRGSGLGPFMRLYDDMQERKAFFDSSAIEDLPAIFSDLPDSLKPDVWLCYLDGEPISGAVVSALGDTAQYLFGASTDQALKVNAGYRLHWAIAEWAQGQGCSWYDLGGDSGSKGLRQFKSGMVGRTGRIVPLPGDFELCHSLSSVAAVKLALGYREAQDVVGRIARSWRTSGHG